MSDLDNIFKVDGLSFELSPTISKWAYEDLGDDPELHRWRAWWESSDDVVYGISLRAYPVIKTNPSSVWINQDGYRMASATGKVWEDFNPKWMRKRLLHNGSGSAWAKPTQDGALESLAIRLTRWANNLERDVQKALRAARVLEELCPENKWAAQSAIETLKAKG